MNKEVIIACDFNKEEELYDFLKEFEKLEEKPYLKIGMELFYACGKSLVKSLKKQGYKIFLDLKLHDIPTTVVKAMDALRDLEVEMINVHAKGGLEMMKKVADLFNDGEYKKPLLIAVTELTSTSEDVVKKEYLSDATIDELVYNYAKTTKVAGFDGIVCSPKEVPLLKDLDLITVTPGIRLSLNNVDDQKRVTTPKDANKLGSSFIVVGRSITKSDNVLKAYKKCKEDFSNG